MSNDTPQAGANLPQAPPPAPAVARTLALVEKSLKRRYRAEVRFRLYGMGAVALGIAFVVFLFYTIISQGYSSFRQSYVKHSR